MPPPIRKYPHKNFRQEINYDNINKAIKTVNEILSYIIAGPPIIMREPAGEIHVDIPLMYQNFALDRMHYDPYMKMPSPKGRPVRSVGISIEKEEILNIINGILKEIWVIEAAEYREPEDVWIIPIAWKNIIISHIKVSYEGDEIIPDYGLTEEVRRHVL